MIVRWMKRVGVVVLLCCVVQSAAAQQRYSDGLDDVLQYAPLASVFALKAAGVESRNDWGRMALTAAASWVVSAGAGWTLKHTVHEWRPDESDRKSFPSGHSIVAFSGATVLHKEFGRVSPWISVAGYGVATFVAVDRVVRDRHHWYDVAAGAGIGFVATELTYFVSDRLIKNDRLALSFTGNRLDVAWQLYK